MIYYTGIGSRTTPDDIGRKMEDLGEDFADRGMVLRSGGADGSDMAFECGCDAACGMKEIYLPWKGFNNNDSVLYNIAPEAYQIAEEAYGARWRNISVGVMKLMARNMYQVMGGTLDKPSDL